MVKNDKSTDSFWINLDLHHPSCAASQITQELALEPWHAANVGQTVGTTVRKSTVWMTHYRKGSCSTEFTQALEDCISLLGAHREFFKSFVHEGGEILFTLNQRVDHEEGVLFSLWLEPRFLAVLGEHDAGLQVQAWSAESEA